MRPPPDSARRARRTYRRFIKPIGWTWGATAEERTIPFPCDPLLPDAHDACFRAVTIDAPTPLVFRWVCQLKLAPYSYDWIDNWGRRSPQTLVPGVEDLEVGQPAMSIFRLVEFESDRHVTFAMVRARRIFGEVAVTYLVVPESAERCRLVAKLLVKYPGPVPIRWLTRAWLPAGDLVMMRRQLLNLKRLAEREASRRVSPPESRP